MGGQRLGYHLHHTSSYLSIDVNDHTHTNTGLPRYGCHGHTQPLTYTHIPGKEMDWGVTDY